MNEKEKIKEFIVNEIINCNKFKRNINKQEECIKKICNLINPEFGKSAKFDIYEKIISFAICVGPNDILILKFEKETLKLIE